MKQLALSLAVLLAGSALAQEIGTEITPTTPSSGVQPQPNNPPPPPPAEQPRGGYVYKPKGAKQEGTGSGAATFTGTKASASSGDFGIRAGFGASGSIGLPSGSSGSSVAAPTVGIAFFAADAFKLLVDLGFGMAATGSSPLLALSATLGFDYLFRTPADVMRPFVHVAGFFSMVGSSNFAIALGAQVGFGAEYFFNPAFSVNGRLMLALPMAVSGNFVLGIFTVTPGVGATWYL